jgi:16S rRNA (cytosine967-C5)-methyltransferase
MSVSPAREAAFRVLLQVESGRKYAVDLLQSPRVSGLKEEDRRLTTELVMGVLRWLGDIDDQIQTLSGKPMAFFDEEVAVALRLGVYQIRRLKSIPKRAAVNESVELVKMARKKSAAGLVNAVLRKCAESPVRRTGEPGEDVTDEYLESARRSVPAWIRERWQRIFGQNGTDAIVLACQSAPHTCLRVVGPAFDREALQRELGNDQVRTREGRYSRRALWVESGDVFSTAAWREGRVMIQDEASQLVAELLNPEPGHRVLDLCAAPGMKAGQIADAMREGMLLACDRSLRRLHSLERIVLRAGWPMGVRLHRVVLDAAKPSPFARLFDRILADVPCSGTGTLARNPEIKRRLRPGDISRLRDRQAWILRRGLELLSRPGRLVYSTCSLEPEENEDVVAKTLTACPGYRMLAAGELRSEFPQIAELFGDDGAFRTRPGTHTLDGFFAAVIERD